MTSSAARFRSQLHTHEAIFDFRLCLFLSEKTFSTWMQWKIQLRFS